MKRYLLYEGCESCRWQLLFGKCISLLRFCRSFPDVENRINEALASQKKKVESRRGIVRWGTHWGTTMSYQKYCLNTIKHAFRIIVLPEDVLSENEVVGKTIAWNWSNDHETSFSGHRAASIWYEPSILHSGGHWTVKQVFFHKSNNLPSRRWCLVE